MSRYPDSGAPPAADPGVAALSAALGAGVVFGPTETDLSRHLALVGAGPLPGHGKQLERSPHGALRPAGPIGVAYPVTTEQVSLLMQTCHHLRIPVTPQGGCTGLAGGAWPVDGSLILSTERMRAIEQLDVDASTMTLQAGVPLQTVQEAADAAGLMYPLDLGARGSCLIGGTIATNAGGNRVLRYGMTRELVLGLEVVLADGTVVNSLNKMLKNNAGYDLKQIFIGSEGTLGIITRAVLRLFAKPKSSSLALCAVKTYRDVVQLLVRARSTLGASLSAYEVMWRDFYRVATRGRSRPQPVSADADYYVLIETLASDPQADALGFERLLQESLAAGLLLDAALAQSAREVQEFWSIRDASGELARLFGRTVNFDVSIPIDAIEQFVSDCHAALRARAPGSETLVFGHVADSNIHLACKPPAGTPDALIETIVYECVGAARGSISAEHGIGVIKRDYLSLSRSAAEIDLMRTLKHALDPHHLLNPGKVLLMEP